MKTPDAPNTPPGPSVSLEALPLNPPTLPSEGDALFQSLLDPTTDVPARLLSSAADTALPREAPLLAETSPPPLPPATITTHYVSRPVFDQIKEQADFTLPEPASVLLLLTGLVGLTARRRMRKSHANHA